MALRDICGFRIWRWSQTMTNVFKKSLFVSMETNKSNIPSDCRNMAVHHWAHLRSGNRAWRKLGLNQSAYLYSSSCSLTAEMTTAGTSAKIKTKKKKGGGGELVVGMNQRPFVCCCIMGYERWQEQQAQRETFIICFSHTWGWKSRPCGGPPRLSHP